MQTRPNRLHETKRWQQLSKPGLASSYAATRGQSCAAHREQTGPNDIMNNF